MNKHIAIIFLLIFTACNLAINYGVYKKGMETSLAVMEEDEKFHEVLEVKHLLKSEFNPFQFFEENCYHTRLNCFYILRNYEDVFLKSVETPPDFMC